ncbi:MAG TPA: hypothetical protein VHY08_27285 [Bacillota bacterium]|nr:hypothetical protein [Bacillota bacterium]
MTKQNNKPQKMNLLDDFAGDASAEPKGGMYLSMLADEPGEGEAAMILNSLVDEREDLNQEAEELIQAVEKTNE